MVFSIKQNYQGPIIHSFLQLSALPREGWLFSLASPVSQGIFHGSLKALNQSAWWILKVTFSLPSPLVWIPATLFYICTTCHPALSHGGAIKVI